MKEVVVLVGCTIHKGKEIGITNWLIINEELINSVDEKLFNDKVNEEGKKRIVNVSQVRLEVHKRKGMFVVVLGENGNWYGVQENYHNVFVLYRKVVFSRKIILVVM